MGAAATSAADSGGDYCSRFARRARLRLAIRFWRGVIRLEAQIVGAPS
jgi:hypothetical protein